MFCPNCGTQLEDGALFCGECGSKLQVIPVTEESPAEAPAPKSNKGLIIGLAAGAAALFLLLMIAAVCLIVGMGGGYKKPIKDLVGLMNKENTDIGKFIEATLPDMFVDAYHTGVPILSEFESFEDTLEEAKEGLEDSYDDWVDLYGKNWKVSYEITDEEQLSKSELKAIKNNYKDWEDILADADEDSYFYATLNGELNAKTMDKYDKMISTLRKELKSVKITDGYVLDVELTIEGKEDYDSVELNLYVIKLNGKWVIDITSGDADRTHKLEYMFKVRERICPPGY